MSKKTRREILEAGAVGISITAYSGAASAHGNNRDEHGNGNSNGKQKNSFKLINNSQQKEKVDVSIHTGDGDEVLRKQFVLQGLNNPGKKEGEKTHLGGRVNNIPNGPYEITFELENGDSVSEEILVEDGDILNSLSVSAHIKPSGELKSYAYLGH